MESTGKLERRFTLEALRIAVWSTFSNIRSNRIGNWQGRKRWIERNRSIRVFFFSLVCKALWNYCDNNYDNPDVKPLWFSDEQLKVVFSLFEESLSEEIRSQAERLDRSLRLLQVRRLSKRPMTTTWINWTKNCGKTNIFLWLRVSTNVWQKAWNISIPFQAMHNNRFHPFSSSSSSSITMMRSEICPLSPFRFILFCLSKRRFSCRLFIFLHSSSPVANLANPPHCSLHRKDERSLAFVLSVNRFFSFIPFDASLCT